MGTLQKIIPHYTLEDWQHWDGVWELIDGHPIAMSPAPIPLHQRVAAEIRWEIMTALKQANCRRCRAYDPIDYIISNDTILVPDIVVVCGDIQKKYLDFPPVLVVEILSPSTALRDRNTKFQLYESQGIKHYLIVDADRKTIEVYTFENGVFQLRAKSDSYSFELELDCVITPDFSSVFDNS